MSFASLCRVAGRHLLPLFLVFCVANAGRANTPPHAPEAKRPKQAIVVCIDPGHPSEAGTGARGARVTELHIVWLVALKLRALLESDGAHVVMTKQSENKFVSNKDRAMIANQAHADLMIRLHCDSDAGTGIAVYAPTRPGSVHGARGPSPSVIAASHRAAVQFHTALIKSLAGVLHDRGLKPDTETRIGGRQGALTGSIYSKVPIVLVEICVLTNPSDEAVISTEAGQWRMARALEAGVMAAVKPE